jgi:F420H(2)-dependent quinone reductase
MRTPRDAWNKRFGRVHNAVYRISKGRLGKRVGKAPVLLLTTTGRKSGEARTKPLFYLADGERFVLVASNAGQDHHPSWFVNLQAKPEAAVEVGDRHVPVTARVADESERNALWPRCVEMFSWYASYQRKTERPIPLVILEPR